MQVHLRKSLALLALSSMLAGCGILDGFKNDDDDDGTPTSPSTPTVSLDVFAGTWASSTASTPASGCGNVKYIVTPIGTNSANVTLQGTCAGSIAVNGSGAGKVNGSALDWEAQGLVSQGGVNCPFTFTNGKAVQDATGTIKVQYSGTVCGIPVSGTETVKK